MGGIQLKVLGYAGRPTKARKPKVFTIRFQAKKGLTLVWPSDWTFMHRGVPSPTQEKRIMTGWFNFS